MWRHQQLLVILLFVFSDLIYATENQADVEVLPTEIASSRWWGVAGIVSWGVLKWDYFSRSPHTVNEGWFGLDTKEGGADKWGHAYSAHLTTHLMAEHYQALGLSRESAGEQAAWTSLLINGVMELGDSFSDYGYSNEDMAMNLIGAYVGYKTVVDEVWRERLDFRLEHNLQGVSSDPTTDYQHYKYLFALKLNGFDVLADTPLRWLELHVGYYARGYDVDDALRERNTYIGVGFNFGLWFERHGWHRTATFLKYVQPTNTSVVSESPAADK